MIVVLPAFAQQSGRGDSYTIQGTVVDTVSKIMLSGANVSIYDFESKKNIRSVVTDNHGFFKISDISRSTTFEIRIDHLGYMFYRHKASPAGFKGTIVIKKIFLKPLLKALPPVEVRARKSASADLEGTIKGKVKDSTYKVVLSSATVAIYHQADSNLIQFAIPNNFGEFDVGKLPMNTPLKIIVTHIGYSPYMRMVELKSNKKILDLGWIFMEQNYGKANVLNEIQVTGYAPVRMNGDTLEFNPRAFKMNANATAEELMRRLPGMVIWGDGDITFNGKKINSLLVDGKPFMGGSDLTAATQNLPKDVLDKVQIYRQRNEKNPLDSTLHANLKLKIDKKKGVFGKVGIGYGSKSRVAADGMLSYYDKRLQISTVGAYNNINKSANDINTLIRSNSFKGDGINTDYQSDFRRAGINVGTTAGVRLQYEILPEIRYKKNKRLTFDQFFKQNREIINNFRNVNTTLKEDSILSSNSSSVVNNHSSTNVLKAVYMQQERNFQTTVSADANFGTNESSSSNVGEQYRTGRIGRISKSNSFRNSYNEFRVLSLETQFNFQKEVIQGEKRERTKQLLSNFTISHRYDYSWNKGDRQNQSSIISTTDASANQSFDRVYHLQDQQNAHTFEFGYPSLKRLLFGFAGLGGVDLNMNLKARLERDLSDILVLNNAKGSYLRDINLTNYRIETIRDGVLKLTLTKNFYSGLTNRYEKRIDLLFCSGIQSFGRVSNATQEVQNFRYGYYSFVPLATIAYNNHQYGSYELNSNFTYQKEVGYPTIEQISPLVDSANIWFIPKGNINIKPEYRNLVRWSNSLESRGPKNPYQIDVVVDATLVKEKISDSTFYDNLGRKINYNVNLNGYRNWHLGAHIRKSYSPNKSHTYRFNAWYDIFSSIVPQYFDKMLMSSINSEDNFSVEIAYSYLDILNLNAKQSLSLYSNRQGDYGIQYKGANNYTRFSGTFQLSKNLIWSTNVNFNVNTAGNQPTVNYAIWNASLTYRFLKGDKGEIKLSALDLLKQNKSIVNTTNRNIQTFGFNNVLQQYFMVSLSYYPRVFGK
ncbi:TonB-dependent receptor family protein [Mucilaginibacter daejeonensis]|uniref:TonB-dependent receptor n=1 Tax=Mucilaginibacter daejeonensis TaxID=398049 RepID=UPI001D1737E9|nr:TonB-dependent receptor [Mucilaginibacter daejeonensis]UEG54017.1 TonB-dependent receptor family protein [Mucilaginibacter daejeonensis]